MHVNLDPLLVDKIANEVKSQGVFDQFRKDSMADVDTKPAYQNLRQRVENTVNKFLSSQMWTPDMNKNHLRERLRKHITEAGFLDVGVERIVDQVVNPKIATVFQPKIEDIAYKYLGIPKPQPTVLVTPSDTPPMNGVLKIETNLLPTDLEQVSPDSDKCTVKDDSKDEMETDDKLDDFESPAFEPIENSNLGKEKFEPKPEPMSEDMKEVKIEEIATPPQPETHSFPFKKYHPQVKNDSSSEDWDAEEDIKPEPPKVEIIAPGTRNESPDDATQDTQLSQVSSDSRLSIVTNGNTQDEHSTACEIKEENNVNISEEAQMPKFSENSNSCSEQKPSEPLHFDIKKDEIKFEGTERKTELPPSADASPNISDEQRVDSSMENKTIDTSEASDIPLPSHEFSFEKDSDFKFSKIEVKVDHLEEVTKTTSLDDSADRELQIIEKSELSQCSMSQTSVKSPKPKPKSPSATSSPVPHSHHKTSHRDREREHSSSSSRHKKYYSSKDRRSDRDRERDRDRDREKDKYSSSSHKMSSSSSRNHHSSSKSSSSQRASGGGAGGGTPSDHHHHHRSSSTSVHKSSKSSSSSSRYSKSSRSHNDGKESHRSRGRDRERERDRDRSKSRSDKSRDKSSKEKSDRSKTAGATVDDHYSSKHKWRKSTDSNDEDSSQEGSQSRGGPKEYSNSQDNATTNGANNNSSTSSGTSNNVNGKAGSSAMDTPSTSNFNAQKIVILDNLLENPDTNFIEIGSSCVQVHTVNDQTTLTKLETQEPEIPETETTNTEPMETEPTTCPHNDEFLFYFENETKTKEDVEVRLNMLTNMMENFRNILKTSLSGIPQEPSTTETTESESGNASHGTDTTSVGGRQESLSPKRAGPSSNKEEGPLTSATLTIDCIQYDNPSISHCLSKRFKYDEHKHTKVSPTPSEMSVNSKENEFLDKNSQSDSDSLGSGSQSAGKSEMNKVSSVVKRKAIVNRNQRYSSEDLYKPRPILSQRSRRRGLDAVI